MPNSVINMPHVFITGDRHGDYKDVEQFCLRWNTSKDDLLIVLGDNGVNYWGPHRDKHLKQRLASLPITFFMIKGNHDQRPSLKLYTIAPEDAHPLVHGPCLYEKEFPSLLFSAIYGKYEFCIDDRWVPTFVLGGAYSADKWYRLEMQALGHSAYRWFADEQMSSWEMKEAYDMIQNAKPEIILSHTCPYKYIPQDMFLPMIDQSTVDDTMEHWMDEVETSVDYRRWYCGHWHTDRMIDKMRFMYRDIAWLDSEGVF